MPEAVAAGPSGSERFFKNYVAGFIKKDASRIIKPSSEARLHDFMKLAAQQTAQELHYDELADEAGIDERTCRKWISLLEKSWIIFLVHPYLRHSSRRIVKAPKLYFMDTGLCAFLCRWPDARMLANCAMSSAFFETRAVSGIVKNLRSFNLDPKEWLFRCHDIDGREDCLIHVEADSITPIEFSSGPVPAEPAMNCSFLSKHGPSIEPGLVFCNTDRIAAAGSGSYFVPASYLP